MKIRPVLFVLLTLALFSACKSNTTVIGNDLGSFRGNVALINANGDTLSSYAGATAQIEGTSFQATSDAKGDWQIDNVPAGIYNITLTKPGFDTLIIPQYEFGGVGTSFIMSTAIQALPLDSLVFTIDNSGKRVCVGDSLGDTIYAGTLTMRGHISGPDSLQEARFVAADSSFNTSTTCYIINDSMSQAAVSYQEPSLKSGSVMTVLGYLYATPPKGQYKNFQGAFSYTTARTFVLP